MSQSRAHSYCPVCMETYADPRFGFCKRDGARLRPTSELGSAWIGRTIHDKYQVVRFLGRGAMAEVYEARHLTLERRVAIKVMQPLLAVDPIAVERFRREARLVALISHPNVVAVEDFGVLEDGTWFVRSRGFAFQPYYDTGFPHGRDQFISSAATSWAAIALAYTL